MICLPRRFKKPYPDFVNANVDPSGFFAESPTHFYSLDGKKRFEKFLPKAKTPTQEDAFADWDNGRRKTMRDPISYWRKYWMKVWGLL